MKSRNSSPQSSPQIMRRFRVNSNPASSGTPDSKPSVRVEELPSIAVVSLAPLRSNSTASRHSGTSGVMSTPQNGVLRRKSSDNLSQQTPARDSLQPNGVSLTPFSPPSPGSENSPATWSSAVGHATTTGKSGRVIERLMTENDKLKRDLNAQVIKCQELEKSMQTYKPQMEALRQENDNLNHARGVDSSLITRRDRKIEELKEDLTSEKSRRETAEELARRREREKDDAEETGRREMQTLTESTKHATLHAEILETSHRQLGAEYRARTDAFKQDLTRLEDGREHDRQKLAKLDIVADQMRQELERSKRVNAEIVETWERLRQETKHRMQNLEQTSLRETDRMHYLNEEMDRVVNEMKWLMGIHKAFGDTDVGTDKATERNPLK